MAGPVIAGVLPPLLPTPTTARTCISVAPPPEAYASKKPTAIAGPVVAGCLPPLLPTPRSCVSLRPPPASYASRQPEGTAKPAGRASSSQSWIKDKLGGCCVSSDQGQESWRGGSGASADRREKLPSRASLSSSWVEDKMLGRAGTSTSSVERAGRPMWRGSSNEGKRSASRAPSADRSEKKARPPTEDDDGLDMEPEMQQYAGPTFVLSPDPTELPIPFWLASPEPSELPVPSFLKAH